MQSVSTTKLYHDFVALRESILRSYPEMKLLVADSVINSPDINNVSDMVKFVFSNQNLLCKALLEAENGKVLREKLMPLVLEKYQEHFVEFASGIVGSFCLGQKQLQDVLRNRWGKYLAGVLGVNIILPKAIVVENLKKKKQELIQLIGLEFKVHGDVVIAKSKCGKILGIPAFTSSCSVREHCTHEQNYFLPVYRLGTLVKMVKVLYRRYHHSH